MATDRLTMFLMAIAPPATESHAASIQVMTVIVELALTYLIHSTLFIGTAWILLSSLRHFRSGQRGLSPANEERLWKFITVLAFVTVPVSQYSGWSWSIWQQPHLMQPSWAQAIPERTDAMSSRTRDDISESGDSPRATSLNGDSTTTPGAVVIPSDSTTLVESGHALLVDAQTRVQKSALTTTPREASTGDSVAVLSDTSTSDSSGATRYSSNVSSAIASIPTADSDHGSASRSMLVVWLGMIIILSISVGTMRLIVKAICLRRFLRTCSPATPPLRKSLPRLRPTTTAIRLLTTGHSDPKLRQSDRFSLIEPFACGIWNGTIVLPRSIEHELSSDELRALLAHETAHLVRRDPLWQWVNEVLCVCVPFQPLHYVVRRRWRQVAELLCDDWVVEQQISAIALARCLTQIAELRLGPRPAFGMSAVDRSNRLTSRVEWLLRDRQVNTAIGRRGPTLIALVAFLLGVGVGVYGPRITLTSAATAGDESASESEWRELESEMKSALRDLDRINSQLNQESNPAIRAAGSRLQQRTESLRFRWNELR